jgi:amino acid adenylation domain-containing protein
MTDLRELVPDPERAVPVSPDSGPEPILSQLWREVVGCDSVEPGDDFFSLGGDSLLAIRMLATVEDLFGVAVGFPEFADTPTITFLVAAIAAERATTQAEPPSRKAPASSPEPSTEPERVPCTPAQERLWFLEEMAGARGVYNMPLGARLRGPLDADALKQSLREIVRRHAALRTRFADDGGAPVQVVDPHLELSLEQHDLSGLAEPEESAQRFADEFTSRPFSLTTDILVRAALLRLRPDEHVLQLVFHHIVCDGWSHVVIFRELAALYGALTRGDDPGLPLPRIQYAEFALGIDGSPAGDELREGLAYWHDRLAAAPHVLELPTDRARPPAPSYRGSSRRTRLPAALATDVRAFARAEGATVFTTLLAVFYVLLHRLSGQAGVVVGATVAGRERSDLEDAVGLFANTVALALELEDGPTFRELVGRVRGVVHGAMANQDVPFERIVAELQLERDLNRHPIFQVFFAHVPQAPLEIAGAEPFDARPSTARFDLTLWVEEEANDQLELMWEYATDLFDEETIARFEAYFLELLQAGIDAPAQRVADLPMIAPAERDHLVEASASKAEFPVACLHELFAAQVERSPDAPALTFEGTTIPYRELDARANAIAHRLRDAGVGPDVLVALCLERSLEQVIAILGVLKAGGAYVPLDPHYPAERLAYILEDTQAPVLLTHESLLEQLPPHKAVALCFGTDLDDGERRLEPPPTQSRPEDLAYVIYTSGSTGAPKGVQVEHRNVARLFSATDAWFGFSEADTWLLFHSYAFDFSVWELWGPLLYGGRLVVCPHWTTRSPQQLAELLVDERVTVMNATPSLFMTALGDLLAVADDLHLRVVVFGGEALRPHGLRPWFERFGARGPQLVNMYGITETTVHVTYRPIEAADTERDVSPIGQPIPDLSMYILDPRLEPVPPGVPGELFVGGAGVARGYLNRKELTAERFLVKPFGGGRLYRTGDRARRRADGEVEFLGRLDDQVKVRGFRIELGEIEAALAEHPAVAECIVRALEVAPGDTRLAAYIVPAASVRGSDPESLRRDIQGRLEEKLPAYMVPTSFVFIEALPLTSNGKLDVRSLPSPVWERDLAGEDVAPVTETEKQLAAIWCEVLGVAEVGRDASFFNLGGHSLLAARVIAQVRERFEIKLSVRSIFDHPTLSAFASHVDELAEIAQVPTSSDSQVPEQEPVRDRRRYPLSANQQQLLFFDQLDRGSPVYNAGLAVAISGPLRRAALERALAGVVERHEALRTALVWQAGVAEQVVLTDWRFELPLIDLGAISPIQAREELPRLLREHARRPFALERDLLLRSTLFRLADEEHVLLLQTHHIAVDAWSVEILFHDISELYEAAVADRPPQLPALALQYGGFAVWQRERLHGQRLQDEMLFWRSALAGAPTFLPLATDRPRPRAHRFEGGVHEVALGPEVAQAVTSACREENVTPYMFLLAVFATLLYRLTGQDDILLGGPFANRGQPDFQRLVGYFANTLVVRARLAGNPTFRELLSRVRETTAELLDHQELTFEGIVDAVRPPRYAGVNPLFQVNFRVRVDPNPSLELAGTSTRRVPVKIGLARFDLALELHVHQEGVLAEFNFDTDLFERQTIERLADGFVELLAQTLDRPSSRLLEFQLHDDLVSPRATAPQARPILRSRARDEH